MRLLRRLTVLVAAGTALAPLAALTTVPAPSEPQGVTPGYTPASAAAQDSAERRLRALVSPESISAAHRILTRRPHPAGSAGSREVIRYLERTLRSYGLEVRRDDYQAWLSRPVRVRVAMTTPAARVLSVREPPLAADPTSRDPALGEGYIAYSGSGVAEGEVVYVNYGLPADYAELARLGVEVKGRIAIARYGRSHRAVKVHTAQEAGATALVLYSDPGDDGFTRGEPWPGGYWRGEQMLQRGNAKMSWYFHGDPLTPGVAATAAASRLDPKAAPTLPRIPVVAISWGEARPVLAALGGAGAPAAFRGGIPIAYHVGPGPARLRVDVRMQDGLRPISNVVATLRGGTQPDRMVLLGGHHDAWTFGGVDPGTGTAALLEVARVLGRMAGQGWRPARTVAIAFWDAEEYGLVGSTEYVEQWRAMLQDQLLMYVNTDLYMRGRFDAGGVPSLRDFVAGVARDVPGDGGTVYDGWAKAAGSEPQLKPLGSGADFVPFQDHLGVATLSAEFVGPNGYGFGTYHSNFDSRAYAERIADPGFAQGAVLARVLATLGVRMANAEVLPFRFGPYAVQLNAWTRAAGEWMASVPGAATTGRDGLADAARRVMVEAAALDSLVERRLAAGRPLAPARARELNDLLARMEQLLTDDEGAPDRRWYRHVVHGWNIYSLYDGQPFPGLAEAVRVKDAARVGVEVGRIGRALDRLARGLRAARDVAATP